MKGDYQITNLHPKGWKDFKRWHKLACPSDPLTAEERFKKVGGIIPKKNVSRADTSTKETE